MANPMSNLYADLLAQLTGPAAYQGVPSSDLLDYIMSPQGVAGASYPDWQRTNQIPYLEEIASQQLPPQPLPVTPREMTQADRTAYLISSLGDILAAQSNARRFSRGNRPTNTGEMFLKTVLPGYDKKIAERYLEQATKIQGQKEAAGRRLSRISQEQAAAEKERIDREKEIADLKKWYGGVLATIEKDKSKTVENLQEDIAGLGGVAIPGADRSTLLKQKAELIAEKQSQSRKLEEERLALAKAREGRAANQPAPVEAQEITRQNKALPGIKQSFSAFRKQLTPGPDGFKAKDKYGNEKTLTLDEIWQYVVSDIDAANLRPEQELDALAFARKLFIQQMPATPAE